MKKSGNKKQRLDYSGSSFDTFLEEEGLLEEAQAVAIKRVIAMRLSQREAVTDSATKDHS